MNTTFAVAGFTFSVATIVVVAASLQFASMAMMAIMSSERLPKRGMRGAEKRLLMSAAIFAVAITFIFAPGLSTTSATRTEASLVITRSHGSCSSLETGMAADVAEGKLGKPDEIRSDEETRGPGAKIWIYRDSRCAVHIFDDKVEFID